MSNKSKAKTTFNLIHAPWLPVRRRRGAVERIAPWGVTERIDDDDPIVAFAWPRPDFDGAAHEFMIGLLSTAAAPADEDEWREGWANPPAPEELERRFAAAAHAFDLDGPGPRFMQDLDPLDGVKARDVAALLIDSPGDQTLRNNADLFVKRGGAPVVGRAAAAMALYVMNAYAPSGGAGHRTSLRGGGPMTTLVVARDDRFGDTLWGRLWPNVETAEQIGERRGGERPPSGPGAVFPWLAPTRTSEKKGGRPTGPGDVDPLQVYWGMPRRIRLEFEDAGDRVCGLTGAEDAQIVARYRTRNYGTNYTEGFEHPLTPYYRQKPEAPAWLPVHPAPGGIRYRHWPGLVAPDEAGLRRPAQAVRRGHDRGRGAPYWARAHTRFAAFGYDMDNMKARGWADAEWPLLMLDSAEKRNVLNAFTRCVSAAASDAASFLARAVKAARRARPADATGDYRFIEERFFRDTESGFFSALGEAARAIEADGGDADDPTLATLDARTKWPAAMKKAALRLFDEYAPADGLEDRAMRRHVRARFFLDLALSGRGKEGRRLFGGLGIPEPERTRTARRAA